MLNLLSTLVLTTSVGGPEAPVDLDSVVLPVYGLSARLMVVEILVAAALVVILTTLTRLTAPRILAIPMRTAATSRRASRNLRIHNRSTQLARLQRHHHALPL